MSEWSHPAALGHLIALWLFVMFALGALRRDLRHHRRAPRVMPQRPAARAPSSQPLVSRKRAKQPGRHQRPTVRHGDPLGSAPITIGRAPDSTLVIDGRPRRDTRSCSSTKVSGWQRTSRIDQRDVDRQDPADSAHRAADGPVAAGGADRHRAAK